MPNLTQSFMGTLKAVMPPATGAAESHRSIHIAPTCHTISLMI